VSTQVSKYKTLSIPRNYRSNFAREYSIPAVMAARNATRHIQRGQIVTVDGKAGTVILENHR
jgi:phosphoenolpyruvate-protein kinase (PTS system EI component)